jgi:hypothetical protein
VVYRNETEQLVAAADRLAGAQPPVTALREWLLLFVDYIATKHGMHEVLVSIVGGTSDLHSASTAKVKQTIGRLADHAIASGDICVSRPRNRPFFLALSFSASLFRSARPA